MAIHAPITGAPICAPFVPGFRHSFPDVSPRRQFLEAEIEVLMDRVTILIARLDRMDPDPDLEMDDHAEEDDHSGQCDEDGINTYGQGLQFGYQGPGCPISDPDLGEYGR